MKIAASLVLLSSLLVGCTTYPKNFTYSPTVTVGGDNNAGITLPSPYAKKPQPVQQPSPVVYQQQPQPEQPSFYENTYSYNDPVYDSTPIYIDTPPNVHYRGPDGEWR